MLWQGQNKLVVNGIGFVAVGLPDGTPILECEQGNDPTTINIVHKIMVEIEGKTGVLIASFLNPSRCWFY